MWLLLGALLQLPLPAQAQTPNGDEVLLQMQQAFRKGDSHRLSALLPQARGHVLEPWAAYWELKARLETATPQEVQAFFERYAGTYQEDRLRNDWLLLLGQRRDWDAFAAELPHYRMKDDREVRCYALVVDHLRTGADVADEVRRLWYAQRDADDGCTLAADRLYAAGRLKPLDIWRKARLAIEANRPRAARAAIEIAAPEVASQVSDLMAEPARYLDKHRWTVGRKRRELALLALIRLATNDPALAARKLEAGWLGVLTLEEQNWAWGAIGRQAALRLQDEASEHFARVSRLADLNDDTLGFAARAALRQGQWPAVRRAIEAMSPAAQAEPVWTYWLARALLAEIPPDERARFAAEDARAAASAPTRKAPAEIYAVRRHHAEWRRAQQALTSIASPRGFYEMLALEDLGQRLVVPPKPAPLTAEEKAQARAEPGLQRALAAIALGLRSEGVREWNYTTNLHQNGGMSDRALLAAADLACERSVWDRCINTSERTRELIDFEQRFPMPHRDAVLQRSQAIGLDPAFVYGLIRQESRFITDARSGVGASGLMQVMPATARWTAKKIGLNGFTVDRLNDRDTNIAIGTAYLKLLLDAFDGSMPLATAAYNAGPGRPRAWRNGPVLEAAIWAENIPFNETRDYVKKVLANTTSYAALITGEPQSLRRRLGLVGPRPAGLEPPENRDLP
ncbi:soluble lytic murein transglycosylase [Tibeticola sediminis]|uniref:Soluble lytic murein transglycosylase n=1 Tax=Tibeticola sediminis TaxID=1917811 RepID=A0A3N4UW95_9BURK|nr:soluble lytic murein transglycosylase [Tibeticola sediminis]